MSRAAHPPRSRLDDTVKQGESIASKTMSMITLMAGLLIALSGYTISILKGFSALTTKDWVGIAGCLYLLGLLIYAINNVAGAVIVIRYAYFYRFRLFLHCYTDYSNGCIAENDPA